SGLQGWYFEESCLDAGSRDPSETLVAADRKRSQHPEVLEHPRPPRVRLAEVQAPRLVLRGEGAALRDRADGERLAPVSPGPVEDRLGDASGEQDPAEPGRPPGEPRAEDDLAADAPEALLPGLDAPRRVAHGGEEYGACVRLGERDPGVGLGI